MGWLKDLLTARKSEPGKKTKANVKVYKNGFVSDLIITVVVRASCWVSRRSLHGFLTILLFGLLVAPAFAQWIPKKDSVGYTYFEAGMHRAYPVGHGYFVVYDLGGGTYQYHFEEGQVFYCTPSNLWFYRGGTWDPYTKEKMLGGMLAAFQRFWRQAYDEMLTHPGHTFYLARNLAAKQMFDTAKRIAGGP